MKLCMCHSNRRRVPPCNKRNMLYASLCCVPLADRHVGRGTSLVECRAMCTQRHALKETGCTVGPLGEGACEAHTSIYAEAVDRGYIACWVLGFIGVALGRTGASIASRVEQCAVGHPISI